MSSKGLLLAVVGYKRISIIVEMSSQPSYFYKCYLDLAVIPGRYSVT